MNEASSAGFELLERGDYQEAEEHFSSLIDQDSTVDDLVGRGRAHLALGQFDAAETDFADALKLDDKDAEANYRMALTVRNNESNNYGHEQAVQGFTKALDHNPTIRDMDDNRAQALILVDRGLSHIALENTEAGEADYDAAVELVPSWWIPHFGRGIRHASARRFTEAAEDFLAVVKDPEWERRYLDTLLTELSNLKIYAASDTLPVYQHLAIELSDLASVQRGLAFCHEKAGEFETAVHWAEKSLAQEPHHYSREIAARSLTQLGEYYRALKHWNALIEGRPDYAYAINMRDTLEQEIAERGLGGDSEVEDNPSLSDFRKAELVELTENIADILIASPSRLDTLNTREDMHAFLKELKVLGESLKRGQIWRPDWK